jgi:hypothetical protein
LEREVTREELQTGGCYCGAVRYEFQGEIRLYANCHCRDCRRVHGAAFSTVTSVSTDSFRITAGEDELREFASETGSRFFCGRCGGRLFNRGRARPALTNLSLATLDREPAEPPAIHINVASKAPWYEILDDRPQFPEFPTSIPTQNDPDESER